MTRINIVEPSHLTNKHLMAEYRELPRIFTAVLKLQDKGVKPCQVDIADSYLLGAGHVKFFYNKVDFLLERYHRILQVLIYQRDYNLDDKLYRSIFEDAKGIDKMWRVPYTPTPEEIYLNMARLCKRSKLDNVIKEILDG